MLAVIGFVAGPGVFAYAVWQVYGPAPIGNRNSLLGGHPGPVAWTAASVAALIGTVAAFFAWRAVRQLGGGDARVVSGARWGIAALMLLLGGVNLLNSYFNQFWVFLDACLQASIVGMLVRVRHRALDLLDGVTHH